jgi:hypothetical protein
LKQHKCLQDGLLTALSDSFIQRVVISGMRFAPVLVTVTDLWVINNGTQKILSAGRYNI